MSDTTISSLNFGTNVAPGLPSATNRNTELLDSNLIPIVNAVNATGPTWNVDGSGVTTGTHAEGSAYPAAANDSRIQLTLGMGLYETNPSLTDEAISRARVGNPVEYEALKLRTIAGARDAHKKKMQSDAVKGTGSNSLVGLYDALGVSSASYGGKTIASYTQLQAVHFTGNGTKFASGTTPSTATPASKLGLRNFLSAVKDNAHSFGQKVLVSGRRAQDQFIALYEGQVRYVPGQAFGSPFQELLTIEGLPWLVIDSNDGYSPSLTTSTDAVMCLEVNQTNPLMGVHFEAFAYQPKLGTAMELEFGIQVNEVPGTGHAVQWNMRNQVQLVVPVPAACGILMDISRG